MKRSFVIPDIHGCNRTFRQLIFHQLELQRTDTLYLLGDYIDRGPDSKGVIATILELQGDGYDVQAIKGNHEQMLIDFFENGSDDILLHWLDNGGEETLDSYQVEDDEISMLGPHRAFIASLPACIVTDAYIFVHAGLDFSLDDPIAATDEEFMLWNRKKMTVDTVKTGGRKVVVGHTPRFLDEIVKSLDTDFIQLDNGCFLKDHYPQKGNLLAWELGSQRLYIQKNIDRKRSGTKEL